MPSRTIIRFEVVGEAELDFLEFFDVCRNEIEKALTDIGESGVGWAESALDEVLMGYVEECLGTPSFKAVDTIYRRFSELLTDPPPGAEWVTDWIADITSEELSDEEKAARHEDWLRKPTKNDVPLF